MKGLVCSVYESKRHGNCSANGISSRVFPPCQNRLCCMARTRAIPPCSQRSASCSGCSRLLLALIQLQRCLLFILRVATPI